MMKKSEIPCKPDCPKRDIHCHSNCPEYEDYRVAKEIEREHINALKKEDALQRYESIRRNIRRKT